MPAPAPTTMEHPTDAAAPQADASDQRLGTLAAAFRRERSSADPALVDWQYIRRACSPEGQRALHRWKGRQSLLEWMRLMGANRPMQAGGLRLQQSLLDESNACYERLFADLGERFDVASLNVTNALDYTLCGLVPHLRSVLDYGAGHGRMAFLFSRIPGLRIFANDAVETSYCCQHWVYRTLGLPLWEHFDQSSPLAEFLERDGPKVIHLPTWRNDLIPDRSLDLVLFVWCLSEMSRPAALHALETCTRTLREGGHIYLRDSQHSHGWWMEKQLLLRGFLPVYQPWVLRSDQKTNGVIRLYRYLPNCLDKSNTAYCKLLFTAWRSRTFSFRQLLVRLRRLLP